MNRFVIAFALAVGIITFDEIFKCHEMPWPPRYVGAGLVYGLLDIGSAVNEQLAGWLAIGFTMALLIGALSPVKAGSQPGILQAKCQSHAAEGTPSSIGVIGGLPNA